MPQLSRPRPSHFFNQNRQQKTPRRQGVGIRRAECLMAPEKESVQLYPSRDQGSHGVHREALFLFSPQPLLTHCHQRSALHVDRPHVAPGKFHLPQTLLCGWLCGRWCRSGHTRTPSPTTGPLPPTCIPQMRTPRQAEVLCAHLCM